MSDRPVNRPARATHRRSVASGGTGSVAVSDVPGFEWTPCPLCGSSRQDFVYERPDLRHRIDATRFRVVRCGDCGMGFVNPRPDRDAIHRWYPPEFYGAEESPGAAIERQRERLAAMEQWLAHLAPGRLLDIGCYKGEFAWWMQQRGWKVRGAEFSTVPPNAFGIDIHCGELATLREAPFDAITMWAVLEHVHDPRALVRDAVRLLRPGGRLFVLVPNFRSIPARWLLHDDVPRHLLMFTPQTLRRLLVESGLEVRRLRCEQSIYSGSVRGLLNLVAKRIAGERHEEIVAQNRVEGRWLEFATTLRGKPSAAMASIDRLDQRAAPCMDRWLDRLGLGFIMTAEAERPMGRRSGSG
ncbi:MAG TPA: methyltransferase domain-containing protein [Phycisphaerales bacterium]|nr:methyltransferase domain-containing protein [Phycisphaerales bacterium]HMP37923.1 methyltransferase domain-containing protein [Phycisphaerales bacterium]